MALERTLRLSRFAARVAQARPALATEVEKRGDAPIRRQEMQAALADGPPEALEARLRQLRERVLFTLAHRDLNGLASLDEVFDTMTALAEVCVQAAAKAVEPQAPLIVAALGKLGGEELNVSSDIDLVFLYDADEEPERFARAGRQLIALLGEPTAHGQAFRVDMRLRPFGDGPIATSLGALEDYFVTHARPWERYAWLKARVVHGDAEAVTAIVEPFVYRRYLDYGLLGSLRELHARIFETAIRRRKADDIKVGPGGIREIEFAVQLFQLVRGGRDRGLRLTSTRKALAALAERQLIDAQRAHSLGEAYAFLRRLEHRLQYYDDQQTQALPQAAEHQAAIAEAMGFGDWDVFFAELERHRGAVKQAFNALFEEPPEGRHAPAAGIAAWLDDPQATADVAELADDLAELGVQPARDAAERLAEFTRSRRYRALSGTLRQKVDRLVPLVVSATVEARGEARTLGRLLQILEAIDRREAYYSLLLEYPVVLARAARLASRSAWVARLLARHPILLDELTRTAASFTATDWKEELRQLVADCDAHEGDLERVLEDLRHFKQRHVFRLTIADLEGELPVMALSDELSALADTVLEASLRHAAKTVIPGDASPVDGRNVIPGDASRVDGRNVIPGDASGVDGPGSNTGFIIASYGKLGGKELGYGSDLDIIFLYDDARMGGDQALRLAQRIINYLSAYTPSGVLYETDLRLRPDGAKGVMVSSLAGFEAYQRTRAWTWEHQALTRARFCAGDAELGARFEKVKDEILATPRDKAKLLEDIAAMRRKMRAEQRRDAKEIKHIEGGVIDLEFCVQALVLAHGPEHPALRENKGNHTLLQRAGALGLIDPALAADAGAAYLAFRKRLHEAALNDEERVLIEGDDLAAERAAVRRLWAVEFGV